MSSNKEERREEEGVKEAPAHKQGQRRRRGKPAPSGSRGPVDMSQYAPQHLARPGPVNNDPLTDKCFFSRPGESLAPVVLTDSIHTGADGLMALATEEYAALVAHAFSVKRSISLSGYCYYAACLTWSRMLAVNALNSGALTFDERTFIDGMTRYKPPKILGAYLAGIGNVSYEGGFHELRFRLKKPRSVRGESLPDFPGYFGTMKGNARFYASYPCIAVFAKRIWEDLRLTHARGGDDEWNLPPALMYDNRRLTSACIGYAPAVPLDASTVATYQLARIRHDQFDVENDSVAVNYTLLNMIQLWIDEVRGIQQLATLPQGPSGSRGQLLLEDLTGCAGDLHSCGWTAYSAVKLNSAVEHAGSTFLYRVNKKYHGTGSHAFDMKLCPFEAFAHAEATAESLNFLRDGEDDAMLSTRNGVSAVYRLSNRLRDFMDASMVR